MIRIHQGVQWMLISTVFFSIMGACVKFGGDYFSPSELVFYRALISLIIIAIIMRVNQVNFKSKYLTLHVTRSSVGFYHFFFSFTLYVICH